MWVRGWEGTVYVHVLFLQCSPFLTLSYTPHPPSLTLLPSHTSSLLSSTPHPPSLTPFHPSHTSPLTLYPSHFTPYHSPPSLTLQPLPHSTPHTLHPSPSTPHFPPPLTPLHPSHTSPLALHPSLPCIPQNAAESGREWMTWEVSRE